MFLVWDVLALVVRTLAKATLLAGLSLKRIQAQACSCASWQSPGPLWLLARAWAPRCVGLFYAAQSMVVCLSWGRGKDQERVQGPLRQKLQSFRDLILKVMLCHLSDQSKLLNSAYTQGEELSERAWIPGRGDCYGSHGESVSHTGLPASALVQSSQ